MADGWVSREAEEWNRQLEGLIQRFGANEADLDIRIYRDAMSHDEKASILVARSYEWPLVATQLLGAHGGGIFFVVVRVSGEIRRRFAVNVPTNAGFHGA